jgi:hypothetical protein
MGVRYLNVDPSLVPLSSAYRFSGTTDYTGTSKVEIRQADCTIPFRAAIPCTFTHSEETFSFETKYYNFKETYLQFNPESTLKSYLIKHRRHPYDCTASNEVTSIGLVAQAIMHLSDEISLSDDGEMTFFNEDLPDILGVDTFVESDLNGLIRQHLIPLSVIRRFKRVTRTKITSHLRTNILMQFRRVPSAPILPGPADDDYDEVSDAESIVTLPSNPWD